MSFPKGTFPGSRLKFRRFGAVSVALGAISVIGFLATRSSPWLSELGWMPDWLGGWADRHGNFRNFPAFTVLAVVLVYTVGLRLGTALAASLGIAFELIQLGTRGRSFDWADIAWSVAGAGVGGGSAWLVRRWKVRGSPLP